MTPEGHDYLLRQVLTDEKLEAIRQQSLQSMLAAAGHRRRQRRFTTAGIIGMLGLLLCWAYPLNQPRRPPATTQVSPPQPPSPVAQTTGPSRKIEIITDTELFALFPGRSLALIGPPGQQQLVFLDQKNLKTE
jgi:hypothetical protein